MTYPPLFAALMTLWPLLAFAGGQGFSPLLALAGLPALAYMRFSRKGVVATAFALGLTAWIACTGFWSPVNADLVSGSLAAETFAVDSVGARLFASTLLAAAFVSALARPLEDSQPGAAAWLLAAFAVQGLILLLLALFTEGALTLFDPISDRATEAMQNITRNANAFALALPALCAALVFSVKPHVLGGLLAAALAISSGLMFADLDAQTALLAMPAAFACALIVFALPRSGFAVLFGAFAVYVLAAPVLFGALVRLQAGSALSLPGSFQSRVWSWEAVMEKIHAAPLFGHGVEAADTWRETFAQHPEKLAMVEPHWAGYRLIPGHAHNMALQIWSETGAIGALLLSLSLIAVAFLLPGPGDLPRAARAAAGGLIGAGAVAFSFAYSAWNEAFWASLVLVAGAIMVMARADARPRRVG